MSKEIKWFTFECHWDGANVGCTFLFVLGGIEVKVLFKGSAGATSHVSQKTADHIMSETVTQISLPSLFSILGQAPSLLFPTTSSLSGNAHHTFLTFWKLSDYSVFKPNLSARWNFKALPIFLLPPPSPPHHLASSCA